MTHISEIIENILVEWAYRVHDGMPNPKNAQHIQELRESMEELNLPNKVIYEVIQNLINEEDIVKNKKSGNTYWNAAMQPKRSPPKSAIKDSKMKDNPTVFFINYYFSLIVPNQVISKFFTGKVPEESTSFNKSISDVIS